MKNLLIFFLAFSNFIFGLEIRNCQIVDPIQHEKNQLILKKIILEELDLLGSSKTPNEKASHLLTKLSTIAQKAMDNQFEPDAYGLPILDPFSISSYSSFMLWEGENAPSESIPITFFAYVWPPKEYAMQYNPTHPANTLYGTVIHSHPIPCALAVLKGSLFQKNYELLSDKNVRQTSLDILEPYEGAIDPLNPLFIHQVSGNPSGIHPTISLHAYGLSSAEKVRTTFRENRHLHIYEEAKNN